MFVLITVVFLIALFHATPTLKDNKYIKPLRKFFDKSVELLGILFPFLKKHK
jgi:hypothetical protein